MYNHEQNFNGNGDYQTFEFSEMFYCSHYILHPRLLTWGCTIYTTDFRRTESVRTIPAGEIGNRCKWVWYCVNKNTLKSLCVYASCIPPFLTRYCFNERTSPISPISSPTYSNYLRIFIDHKKLHTKCFENRCTVSDNLQHSQGASWNRMN